MRLAGDLDGNDSSERLLQLLEFCHHFRVGMTIYTHQTKQADLKPEVAEDWGVQVRFHGSVIGLRRVSR
jgi:hypothetical protein